MTEQSESRKPDEKGSPWVSKKLYILDIRVKRARPFLYPRFLDTSGTLLHQLGPKGAFKSGQYTFNKKLYPLVGIAAPGNFNNERFLVIHFQNPDTLISQHFILNPIFLYLAAGLSVAL